MLIVNLLDLDSSKRHAFESASRSGSSEGRRPTQNVCRHSVGRYWTKRRRHTEPKRSLPSAFWLLYTRWSAASRAYCHNFPVMMDSTLKLWIRTNPYFLKLLPSGIWSQQQEKPFSCVKASRNLRVTWTRPLCSFISWLSHTYLVISYCIPSTTLGANNTVMIEE